MIKDNQKMMSLLHSVKTSKVDSAAVQVARHPQVTQVSTGVEIPRSLCSHSGGLGHTIEVCWELLLEKRPMRLSRNLRRRLFAFRTPDDAGGI